MERVQLTVVTEFETQIETTYTDLELLVERESLRLRKKPDHTVDGVRERMMRAQNRQITGYCLVVPVGKPTHLEHDRVVQVGPTVLRNRVFKLRTYIKREGREKTSRAHRLNITHRVPRSFANHPKHHDHDREEPEKFIVLRKVRKHSRIDGVS